MLLRRKDIELHWVVTGAGSFPEQVVFSLFDRSHISGLPIPNYTRPISPPSPNFPNCPFGASCPFVPLLAHITLSVFMT